MPAPLQQGLSLVDRVLPGGRGALRKLGHGDAAKLDQDDNTLANWVLTKCLR
jgi:hypothetical protein